jgi:hypothetical protein
MRFARWVFLISGIYGVLVLAPQYFLEQRLSRDYPPALTHPELYYGFIGTALAFQVLFLAIAKDPARLRPAMPAAILEKVTFAAAVGVLQAQGRVYPVTVVFASIDALWAVLFILAYLRTRAKA